MVVPLAMAIVISIQQRFFPATPASLPLVYTTCSVTEINSHRIPPPTHLCSQPASCAHRVLPRFIWLFISRCWFSLPVTRFQLLLARPCLHSLLARTRYVVAQDEHEKRRRPTTIIILCRDLFFVCSKIVKGSSPAGE